jgi:hypothetical protein
MTGFTLLSLVTLTAATTAVSAPLPHSGRGESEKGRLAHPPAPGSAERKAIALALHAPCERDLKQKVMLKFIQLRVAADWAMAQVRPLQPNERSIDYRRTKYRKRVEEGMFDESGEALLRRENGRWNVLEWRFGNTDTEMVAWIKKHRAPRALTE